MPTLGTVLIIAAGKQAWLNRVMLSNRVLVWFGLISFPLYLWHWPLLSFARVAGGEMPARDIRVTLVVISIALAWMTYRFIEVPMRFGRFKATKAIALIVPMILVGGIGYSTYGKDGLRFRAIEKSVQQYMSSSIAVSDRKNCKDLPFAYQKDGDWFCAIGDISKTSAEIFVYGDSHAHSLLPALERLGVEGNLRILFASSSGCLPLLGVKVERGESWLENYNCPKLNDRIFEYVKNNNIKNVFLISRWTYYSKSNVGPADGNVLQLSEKDDGGANNEMGIWYDYGIANTIGRYKEIGVNVYIFEDNPDQRYDPMDVLRKTRSQLNDSSINNYSVSRQVHKNHQAGIASKLRGVGDEVNIINFDDLLCQNDRCPLVVDGKFMYEDHDHLSINGAMRVYPAIQRILSRLRSPVEEDMNK